jgi:hypothetical protein
MFFADCGPSMAGRAHAAGPQMSQPRAPRCVTLAVTYKIRELQS